jgi:hypothetical protein
MQPLERPSLEAYAFAIITIVVAVMPMTMWLRAVLILVGTGLLIDIIWRSKWSIDSLKRHHKMWISGAVIALIAVGSWLLLRQPAESKEVAHTAKKSDVAPTPTPVPTQVATPVLPKAEPRVPRPYRPHDKEARTPTPTPVQAQPTVSSQTGPAIATLTQTQGPCGGGIAMNGGTANGGTCGPPPLSMTTTQETVTSDRDGLIKTIITVTPNVAIPAPTAVAVEFDNPITSMGFWVRRVAQASGGGPFRNGTNAMITIGTGFNPQHPLLLTVYSVLPVKVLKPPTLE